MKDFKGKKVTVMGIGSQGGGVSAIKWLVKQGAKVIATDMKSEDELKESLSKIKNLKGVEIVVGEHRRIDFENVDMVVKNPVVPWTNEFIQLAVRNKIPVEMDSSLFFRYCSTKNIIGITGTKGKTTTSLLVSAILKEAGREVIEVGIGQEPVLEKLEETTESSWVVFELSSWRLSNLDKIKSSPTYAIITNIYQDHLNYYGSMENYVADKEKIFLSQGDSDLLILNWDDEIVSGFAKKAKSKKVFFSRDMASEKKSSGEEYLFFKDGELRVVFEDQIGKICDVNDLKVRGRHNIQNVLAAAALTLKLGIFPETIKKAVSEFKGVPHRMELIDKINGVSFYNDSAATTPDATIAGVESFNERINLICGGADKKLDLSSLAKKIVESSSVTSIFLLEGVATDQLREKIKEFRGEHKIINVYNNIEATVKEASVFANSGEVVLLSPGCSSFGMFKNEFDRGEKFKEAVRNLREIKS